MTEASHEGFGGLYTATRGLARALSEHGGVESVIRTGRGGATCGDADVCHAHGMWASSALVSLGWRLRHRRPLLVAPHGMLDPWALEQSALAKKMALATYEGIRLRTAACLHALCDQELDSIRRIDPHLPAFVVPNGVDLPEMQPILAARAAGASDRRKTLLYLGRIHPKKGIDLAIRALASAIAGQGGIREQWTFEVCGSGDPAYVEGLRRLASELGIADLVSFTGPVSGAEKVARLVGASAFVLASRSEGVPMAVLEAWAYGLPGVVSEACNLPAAAAAGAALSAVATQSSVSRALAELLRMDEGDRLAMGARARTYVERMHAWGEVASRMASVYRWAMGDGPRPDPA